MDDRCDSGRSLRCNLKKVRNKWFIEVDDRLHHLSVLNKFKSVQMEENIIFADESVYQIKVTDSNKVKLENVEDISDDNLHDKEQTSNEILAGDDLCKNSISHDIDKTSNERFAVDGHSNNSISQDEGQISNERLAEDDLSNNSISQDEGQISNERLAEDGVCNNSISQDKGQISNESLAEDGLSNNSISQDEGQTSNERLAEDGVCDNSISKDDGQISNERLAEDGVCKNSISQDERQISNERIAEGDVCNNSISQDERQISNERIADDGVCNNSISQDEGQIGNERIAEEDVFKTSISQDEGQISNDRLAEDDVCKSISQDEEQTSNKRLAEGDVGNSIYQEKLESSNERISEDDGNDSGCNVSDDTEDIENIYCYIDETLEFGHEEYMSEEEISDATQEVEKGSNDVETEDFADNKTVTVTALFEFKASLDDEISFKAGDVFSTNKQSFSDRNIWIKATHKLSGQIGFIPSNYVIRDFKSYYLNDCWHNLDREETERRLLSSNFKPGAFLIRDSSDALSLVLSVKDVTTVANTTTIQHYKIQKDGKFYIAENLKFPNISDMIHFFRSRVDNGLCCRLGEQLEKKIPDVPFRDLELQRESVILRDRYYMTEDMDHISYVGKWREQKVIIQQFKQSMIDSFITEIRVLKQLDHKGVISLLAVYTKEEPFLMVNEIMELGPLETFLRYDQGLTLQLSDLLEMTIQIAEGMEYLGRNNLVHRDLRTGNILVGYENNVKIAGFKLARWLRDGSYEASDEENVPVKWSPVEALNDGIYTKQSDVWSFGVLLYEMITFGAIPYPGKGIDETVRMVRQGYRMERPKDGPLSCPQQSYDLMLKCWDSIPEKRPTFNDIIELFKSYKQSETKLQLGTVKRNMTDTMVSGKRNSKNACVSM